MLSCCNEPWCCSDDEYEDVVYYALKGVDRTMDIMEWELPNLGIKLLNVVLLVLV